MSPGGSGGTPYFSLRSSGPDVLTPDGVTLHTEVDEVGPDADPGRDLGADAPGADAPTLVWVHGWALSLDNWHFQRLHFRGRVRQVFYDQRSHGRSTRSAPERCRVPQLAEDLRQVLAEVAGDGPVVLVGHSMGGMTVMHLASAHPELFGPQVRGVVLLNTSSGQLAQVSPVRAVPGRVFGRLVVLVLSALNRLPGPGERHRGSSSALGRLLTRRLAFGRGGGAAADRVAFAADMIARTPFATVADFYPGFAEVDETAGLAGMAAVPCAVVGAEDDLITPVEHTATIARLLPDAVVVRLVGCGHLGMIEQPERVDAVVEQVCARVRQQDRSR